MTDTTDPIRAAADSLLILPDAPEPEKIEVEAGEEEPVLEQAEPVEVEAEEAESTEATEEEAETDAPQTFTVKVDGKEVAVTLDDLTRSYSGQAYIQKGMQEAAEARKAAVATIEALQAEQAKFLEVVEKVRQTGIIAPPKAPDPALSKTDPIGYLQADAEYRQHLSAYQEQQAQIEAVNRNQAALKDAQMAKFIADQKAVLAEKIPEIIDPVKGVKVREGIRKIGAEVYGFTEQELSSVVDARHVQVLYDAMQWRQLQAGKAQPIKAAPPKTLKPQAKLSQPPQLARAKQLEQAKKSGDLRAIAAAALLIRN